MRCAKHQISSESKIMKAKLFMLFFKVSFDDWYGSDILGFPLAPEAWILLSFQLGFWIFFLWSTLYTNPPFSASSVFYSFKPDFFHKIFANFHFISHRIHRSVQYECDIWTKGTKSWMGGFGETLLGPSVSCTHSSTNYRIDANHRVNRQMHRNNDYFHLYVLHIS